MYAPFTGKIVGQEKPYRNKNAINDGVRLSGRGKSIDLGHGLVLRLSYLMQVPHTEVLCFF